MTSKRKWLVFLLPIPFLLGGTLFFSSAMKSPAQKRERDGDGRDNARYETYKPSTILQLDYGDGADQVGLIRDVEDFRAIGPMSFAVEGETVYVLDEVNESIKAFDRNGHLIKSIQIPNGSDIAVGNHGTVYLLDGGTDSILEYKPNSESPIRHTPNETITGLSTQVDGTISAKIQEWNGYAYSIDSSSGVIRPNASLQRYACVKTGEHAGRVIDQTTGEGFNVTTQHSFGSISFLGQDREENLYIVIEELLPSDSIQVNKEVRKYTPHGELVAVIPVDIDYIAHPEKELILDENGSVYHLLPLKDHLVVQKWMEKK